MPFPNTKDPIVLNFLLECYQNESKSRLKWREKHSKMFRRAAELKGELNNYYTYADIEYAIADAAMAATTRDYIEAARHRLLKTGNIELPITDEPSRRAIQTMFPIKPEDNALRIDQGRKAYLKKRNELSPEDKYVFPETSSWTYGWRMKDSEMTSTVTRYPRLGAMKDAIYSKVGPQPDPDHYKDPNRVFCFCARFT